jgi:hypothetical protein
MLLNVSMILFYTYLEYRLSMSTILVMFYNWKYLKLQMKKKKQTKKHFKIINIRGALIFVAFVDRSIYEYSIQWNFILSTVRLFYISFFCIKPYSVKKETINKLKLNVEISRPLNYVNCQYMFQGTTSKFAS